MSHEMEKDMSRGSPSGPPQQFANTSNPWQHPIPLQKPLQGPEKLLLEPNMLNDRIHLA